MTGFQQWCADMDVWQLDKRQRVHHLKRMCDYHVAQLDRIANRTNRTTARLLVWAIVAFGSLAAVAWVLLR